MKQTYRVLRSPRESVVQREVVALYRGCGCQVGVFSEGRQTRIPPGWPDLVVFGPLSLSWSRRPKARAALLWFHETKSATGKLSEVQELMHVTLGLRGQRVIVGGVDEAKQFLRVIGLLMEGA